ncbi:MAG TPA: TIGR04053 family radical SAM/SPASM domain-containing protein [Acidimicrobiales bacterium]|nr:TIGR04053 family radical SAM/SPASM domain-containing protein [Acidimicrobiales bacterium]
MGETTDSPQERAGDGAGARSGLRHLRYDLSRRPFLVLFELTRACELACRHCRAEAKRERDPDELTTDEVAAVLDDLGALGSPRPIVVFTGGDPLMRPDLLELVRHGVGSQLAVSVAPAGTPRAARALFRELRQAGVATVSLSIDGASAETHDRFRLTQGSFNWTVAACVAARQAGLRLQLNTTVTAATVHELPEILSLARRLGVSLWSVFFLVPMGRGSALQTLSAEGMEDALEFLYEAATVIPLKTTEAPQYRRIVLRHGTDAPRQPVSQGSLYAELHDRLGTLGLVLPGSESAHRPAGPGGGRRRAPLVVGDGRGVVFISARGKVQPSGFLPLVAGNVRERPLPEIYSDSELFRSLRDPDQLHGRCGRCEYRVPCGGSRARAFAASGDPLAEDPGCPYQPAGTPAAVG